MSGVLVVSGEELELGSGESVLDGLLRHGHSVGHSCRAGHCQACLVRGAPAPAQAQVGLKSTLAAEGYFLACQARPAGRIELLGTEAPAFDATVLERTPLGADIVRLRLEPRAALDYHPGQFVNLCHPEGAVRSYSLASCPDEPWLELHVRRVSGGQVSGWIHDALAPGDTVSLQGPHGQCYYVPGRPEQPLLLAGAGTGLAPLWGIVRDALAQGHQGPIHLIQGALTADRLYLVDELDALAAGEPTLHIHLTVLQGGGGRVRSAPLDELAAELALAAPSSPRGYLCGDPGLVKALQRALFLAGAASADLFADPFLAAPTPLALNTEG